MKTFRFNQKADEALDRFYGLYGAITNQQKINVFELVLGGKSHITFGLGSDGKETEEMRDAAHVGCLEYEYLGNLGLIELELS